jgi:hypothetical protein
MSVETKKTTCFADGLVFEIEYPLLKTIPDQEDPIEDNDPRLYEKINLSVMTETAYRQYKQLTAYSFFLSWLYRKKAIFNKGDIDFETNYEKMISQIGFIDRIVLFIQGLIMAVIFEIRGVFDDK